MQFPTYKCDGCGRVKQDSNHWWQFVRLPGPRIVVFAWDCPVRDENAKVLHLCGEGCVMKAVTTAMQEG
jgi:hypothetical protein